MWQDFSCCLNHSLNSVNVFLTPLPHRTSQSKSIPHSPYSTFFQFAFKWSILSDAVSIIIIEGCDAYVFSFSNCLFSLSKHYVIASHSTQPENPFTLHDAPFYAAARFVSVYYFSLSFSFFWSSLLFLSSIHPRIDFYSVEYSSKRNMRHKAPILGRTVPNECTVNSYAAQNVHAIHAHTKQRITARWRAGAH